MGGHGARQQGRLELQKSPAVGICGKMRSGKMGRETAGALIKMRKRKFSPLKSNSTAELCESR